MSEFEKEYELDEVLSNVSALTSVNNFLEDDELDFTLQMVVQLIANPNIPANKIGPLIGKLQAITWGFSVKAKNYMLIEKHQKDATTKKNMYMTLAKETQELVHALKYMARGLD